MPEENILPFGDVSFLKRKALANRNIQPDLSYLYAYSTKFDEFGKNDAFVTRETDQAENRAINQSFVDKVGNAAVQGLTTAGTSFIGGTLGLANGLIDVVSGKNFFENSTFKILQEIDEASKEAFPLYKTRAEQQGSFTDQVLSDDFFLDSLFNGLGFVAGGWGSGALVGAGVRGLTNALGKGLRYAKLGQNSKVVELAAQAGIENPELFGTTLGKLAQKLPNMTAATSGRIYESALEANQVYDSLQEKIQNGELTEAEAKQIRNSVFGVNMLLAIPEYYQYTKFLDNFSNKRATLNAIKNVEGKFVQDKLTGKSAALTNLGQLGFQTGTEALEEGFQFVASKAGEEGNVNYGEAFADAALQSLSDPQFYASMVAGGLVGGVMGGVGTVVGESESTKRNKFTEQVVDLMNKHLPIEYTDKLNKAQTKFNNFYDLEQQKNKVLDAIEVEQDPAKVAVLKDAYRVLDHEQLTNFVQAASESGTYEERLEELELLTKESDENLKNLANIRANKVVDGREINPQQVLRERIQKVKEFKKTYDTVAETYPNIELNELNNKFKAQSLFEFADKKENLVDKEIQKEEARIFNSAGDNPVAKDRLEQLKTEKEYYAGLKKQAVIDFQNPVIVKKSNAPKPITPTKEKDVINGIFSKQKPATETSDKGIDRGDKQQGDTTIVDTEVSKEQQSTVLEKTYNSLNQEKEQILNTIPGSNKRNKKALLKKLKEIDNKLSELSPWMESIQKAKQTQDEFVEKNLNPDYEESIKAYEKEKESQPSNVDYIKKSVEKFKKGLKIKTDEELYSVYNELNQNYKDSLRALSQAKYDNLKGISSLSQEDIDEINEIIIANANKIEAVEEEVLARDLKKNKNIIVLEEVSESTKEKRYILKQKEIEESFKNNSVEEVSADGREFLIRGKKYTTLFAPLTAINRNNQGTIVSVTLRNEKNEPVTFTQDRIVDEIAFAILSTEVLKQNPVVTDSSKTQEIIDSKEDIEFTDEVLLEDLTEIQETLNILSEELKLEKKSLKKIGFETNEINEYIKTTVKGIQYKELKEIEAIIKQKIKNNKNLKINPSKKVTVKAKIEKNELTKTSRKSTSKTSKSTVRKVDEEKSGDTAKVPVSQVVDVKLIEPIVEPTAELDALETIPVAEAPVVKSTTEENKEETVGDQFEELFREFDDLPEETKKNFSNDVENTLDFDNDTPQQIESKVSALFNKYSFRVSEDVARLYTAVLKDVNKSLKKSSSERKPLTVKYFQDNIKNFNSSDPYSASLAYQVIKIYNSTFNFQTISAEDFNRSILSTVRSITDIEEENEKVVEAITDQLISGFAVSYKMVETSPVNNRQTLYKDGKVQFINNDEYDILHSNDIKVEDELEVVLANTPVGIPGTDEYLDSMDLKLQSKNKITGVLEDRGFVHKINYININNIAPSADLEVEKQKIRDIRNHFAALGAKPLTVKIKNVSRAKIEFNKDYFPIEADMLENIYTYINGKYQGVNGEFKGQLEVLPNEKNAGVNGRVYLLAPQATHKNEVSTISIPIGVTFGNFKIEEKENKEVIKEIRDNISNELLQFLTQGKISDDSWVDKFVYLTKDGKTTGKHIVNLSVKNGEPQIIHAGKVIKIDSTDTNETLLEKVEDLINNLSFNLNNKELRNESTLPNSEFTYQELIVKGQLLKTNIATKETKAYGRLYAFQPTFYFEVVNQEAVKKESSATGKIATAEEVKEIIENQNLESLKEDLKDLGINFDIDEEGSAEQSIDIESSSTILINPELALEEEAAIIDSLAYKLLSGNIKDVENNLIKAVERLKSATGLNPTQQEKANFLKNNILNVLEKFDEYSNRAVAVLTNLNFSKNKEGIFESFADTEDSAEQYVDEASSKENRLDSMYDEIRRMLSFIPDYNNNGTVKTNSIGMDVYVPIDFVFTQIVEELTTSVYTNTAASYKLMVDKLAESKSPYLNKVASILNNSPNKQLRRQFYQVFSAEKENPITVVATLAKQKYRVFKNESDNSTGANLIKGEFVQKMYNNPRLSTRQLINNQENNVINKSYIQSIIKSVENLLANTSYFEKNIITNEGLSELQSIFNALGMNINKIGLTQYLQKREGFTSATRNDNKFLKEVFLDLLLKKGFLTSSTLQDLFINEGTIFQNISKAILLTSSRAIAGTYRVSGVQYSSFTNSKPITEKLNWFKSKWSDLKNTLVYKNLRAQLQNIKVIVDRGFRFKNEAPKFFKDSNPIEFEIMRMLNSQIINKNGENIGLIKAETLSDKSTNLMFENITPNLENILLYNETEKKWGMSNVIKKNLYNYFNMEVAKIQQYQIRQKISEKLKLKNADSTETKKGAGEYFYYYEFLNAEILAENTDEDSVKILKALYDKKNNLYRLKSTLTLNDDVKNLIQKKILQRFNSIVLKTLNSWEDFGIISKKKDGTYYTNIMDEAYKENLIKKYGTDLDARTKHAVIDFVYKNMTVLIETNLILGDPAQQSKIPSTDKLLTKDQVLQGILSTFDNLSKRNARLLAQGRRGFWKKSTYKVAIVNDMNVDASNIEQYEKEIQKFYKDLKNEKLTDAQEFTTVWEHLNDRYAHGEISTSDVLRGMMLYDPEHYQMLYNDPNSDLYLYFGKENETDEGVLPFENLTEEQIKNLDSKALLQPRKPVQVFSNLENGIIEEFYIKTSSVPLVPAVIKDGPMKKVRENMIAQNIDRLTFPSAVKIGNKQVTTLFDNNGNVNDEAFLSPITLERSGYHIQLNIPYDESKNTIRQVTQAMKLLFVNLANNTVLSSGRTVAEVKQDYIEAQKRLVEKSKAKLISELLEKTDMFPDAEGNYVIKNVEKLAQVLENESARRDFTENAKKMLKTDGKGNFLFPLIFNPNIGKIQPVLQALITNSVMRTKISGKSYVQVSEVLTYKSFGKNNNIKSEEALTEEERNSIIYTSAENKKGKLNYIKKGKGKDFSERAQVYVPFYFTHKGKKLKITDFIKDGYIDLEKLPKELLTSIGFRIPTEGRKSMMVFEVAGFLPESMGDTIIVPSELAIQMGSDYDVDKLFMYNYEASVVIEPPSAEEIALVSENLSQKLALSNPYNKPIIAKLQNNVQDIYNELNDEINPPNEERAIELSDDLNTLINEIFLLNMVADQKIQKQIADREELIKELRKSRKRFLVKRDSDVNKIVDIYQEVLLSADIFNSVVTPQGFDSLQNTITEFNSKYGNSLNKEWLGFYDPNYQRDTFFDNKAGKTGVGVGANANTFHAMAQEANLFIKGTGVMFKDEKGNYYTENVKENRINEYTNDLYSENQSTSTSAWRLDKIFGFDGGVISERISEWLAASVDNAKEKLLGLGGINNYNLGVGLTIIQTGFNHNWVINFINQPILKEYYKELDKLKSMFDTEYDYDKKEKKTMELLLKYVNKDSKKLLDLRKDGFTLEEYKSMLNKSFEELSDKQKEKQVAILLAFKHYEELTTSINSVQGAMIIDSKGLPKNYIETIQLVVKQSKLIEDAIGNVSKLKNTVVGEYIKIPKFAVNLYSNIYQYSKTAYSTIESLIAETLGKTDSLTDDDTNSIYNGLFSYVYSHPLIQERIADGKDINAYKADLWINLKNRFTELKEKYPNNNLLRRITINQDNLLTMGNSFVKTEVLENQITNAWLDLMKTNQKDLELRQFGLDLAAYSLYFNANLFGVSNFFKYIPFEYYQAINLSSILKSIETNLSSPTYFKEFEKQYFQHNPQLAKSITGIIKNASNKDVEKKYVAIPNTDTNVLTEIFINTDSEIAKKFVSKTDLNNNIQNYLRFVAIYNFNTSETDLYQLENTKNNKLHYKIIDRLGLESASIVEYKFEEKNKRSIIPNNKVPVQVSTLTQSIKSSSAPQNSLDIIEATFKDSQGKPITTVNELLEGVLLNSNEYYTALATYLKDKLNDYTIEYGALDKAFGEHNSLTKTIKYDLTRLERKYKDNKDLLLSHVLHELVHGVTASKLKDPEFQKTPEYEKLKKVYDKYLNSFTEKEKANLEIFKKYRAEKISSLPKDIKDNYNIYYAADSILEFVTETLTSEIVQRRLASEGMSIKKIINDLLELIKKALNIEKGSLLDEAVDAIMQIADYNEPGVSDVITTTVNNPAEYTNHSGGAKGYDAEWDLIGAEFGMVNNKHYLLPSDGAVSDPRLQAKGVKPVDATNDVGPVALQGPATGEAQIAVTNAERAMGRIELNHTTRNTKKIRNYAQVKNADGIFAIGSLIPKGADITVARGQATKKALVPQVNGGTSVAVQLGITMGKPTYVFNQVANNVYSQGWYKWDSTKQDFVSIDTPTLTKNFAGIGTSSNTTEAGKQAIRDVYANTFKSTESGVSNIVTETSTKVITDVEKLAKLNKGRTVKIKYYKYKNSFDAIVTGKVQMVLGPTISINDITKEEKIIAPAVYQIEFKTNTGKLITADESDVTGLINTETGSESTEKSIETKSFFEFGTEYKFTLENGKPISAEYRQKGGEFKFMNPKNIQSKYDSLVSKDVEIKEKNTSTTSTTLEIPNKKYELFPGVYANEGQKEAIDKIEEFLNSNDDKFLLKGRGGTGKTTIIKKALGKLPKTSIIGATVSDEARQVLQENMSGYKTTTVAGLLGLVPDYDSKTGKIFFRERNQEEEAKFRGMGKSDPIENAEYIIIDEASMINDFLYNKILNKKLKSAKVIFMGDNVQIPPINESGQSKDSPIWSLDKNKNFAELNERMRQGAESPILPITDIYANNVENIQNNKPSVDNPLKERRNNFTSDGGVLYETDSKKLVDDYVFEITNNNNPKQAIIIGARNTVVDNFNSLVRQKLFNTTEPFVVGDFIRVNSPYVINGTVELPNGFKGKVKEITPVVVPDVNFTTYNLTIEYEYLNENNVKKTGVKKITTISPEEKDLFKNVLSKMAVKAKSFSKGTNEYKAAWSEFYTLKGKIVDIGYNYAITSHKVQGSTYNSVYVLENDIMTFPGGKEQVNRMMYTAVSRPRKKLVIYNPTQNVTEKSIDPSIFEFKTSVRDFMQNLTKEEREIFRELKEKEEFKTECK